MEDEQIKMALKFQPEWVAQLKQWKEQVIAIFVIWKHGNIHKVNRILHRFFPFQLKIQKIIPLRKLSTITSIYFSLQKCCLVHRNPLAQANWMVCLILS